MIGADRAAQDTPLVALLAAAGKGDAAGVAAILDQHPDLVNQRGALSGNTGLRTALHFGVGHLAVVNTLLDRGADPNIRDDGDNAYPIHLSTWRTIRRPRSMARRAIRRSTQRHFTATTKRLICC